MSDCPAKPSACSMGVIIRSTVRKAAKLAVYDEIIIRVKNHHIPPTIRVEVACILVKIKLMFFPIADYKKYDLK